MPKPRNYKPPRPREPPKDPNESVTIGGVTATRAQHKAVATMRRNHKKRARKNAKRQQSSSPALDPYTAALNEDSRAFAGQDVSEMMEWGLAERLGLVSRPRVANEVYEEVWEGFEEPVGEEERTARAARAAAGAAVAAGEENRGVIWWPAGMDEGVIWGPAGENGGINWGQGEGNRGEIAPPGLGEGFIGLLLRESWFLNIFGRPTLLRVLAEFGF